MSMKPIPFNTDMVRALLENRKTVARRVVKPQPKYCAMSKAGLLTSDSPIKTVDGIIHAANATLLKPSYQPGNILYVQETWARPNAAEIAAGTNPNTYLYAADAPLLPAAYDKWRSSSHMPKEAARIFLRVTGVRIERLQDITTDEIIKEADKIACINEKGEEVPYSTKFEALLRVCFGEFWDSTIKPADRTIYGWAANPWVWVIEFERCEKPKVNP